MLVQVWVAEGLVETASGEWSFLLSSLLTPLRVQGQTNWCTHNTTLLSLQCIKVSYTPCTRRAQCTSWFMQILGSGGKRLALGVISLMWSSPIFPNYLGSWYLTARGKNNTPTLVGTPQFWKNHFKKYCKATMLHQCWRESFRKRQGPDTCGRYDFLWAICVSSFAVFRGLLWGCQ